MTREGERMLAKMAGGWRWQRAWIAGLSLALPTGCAHFPTNDPLPSTGATKGYRFRDHALSAKDKETFVVLALSGGGTRAATLAYSVMQEMSRANLSGTNGRTLLDEVDVISSVSGGSFAAAYYGLHGNGIFEDFEDRFLRRNIQKDLFWQVLQPMNWPRLASFRYDRVDMAADFYDQTIFDSATYGDLAAAGEDRPFVILNATDMSLGSRFEFTQDQFDLLHSNLSTFPVARAVAASSAFPGLLSPIRLLNHPDQGQVGKPGWIDGALQSRIQNPASYRRGSDAASYLRGSSTKDRRFVHLLDGGISDNIGLRGTLDGLSSRSAAWSLLDLIEKKQIKRLVVVAVDAKTEPPTDWDQRASAPGILDVMMTVATSPMDNYSADTIHFVSETLKQLGNGNGSASDIDFHFVHVTFDDVKDAGLREKLHQLPTSFHLTNDQVDLLLEVGPQLLRDSPSYQKLLKAMGSS